MFKKELKTPLSNLLNLSFECGAFPEILKTASVAPFYKKDDPLNCNNYRPICLLSNITKIIEKIVHKRSFFFLEKNNYLYELQFGFRNKTSTTMLSFILQKRSEKHLIKDYLHVGSILTYKKLLTQ